MDTYHYHRFLDEAGDCTFYGKGKIPIIGTQGVSNVFILGMLHIKEPLPEVQERIRQHQIRIEQNPYYCSVPSVQRRVQKGGFFFHAKDDIPEIRKEFYDFILTLNCSFQAVVGRKIISLFERKHNGRDAEFYADLMSHLLKDKLQKSGRLVLNVAEKGSSTSQRNLEVGMQKARDRFVKRYDATQEKRKVRFNVRKFKDEPLLAIVDYLCWSLQRVFERGETRYYDYMQEKISLVIDLYDQSKYHKSKNYYNTRNPLTKNNKVSPHTP